MSDAEGSESLSEGRKEPALVEQGRGDLRDLRVRDAEGGPKANEGLESLSKGRDWRSGTEDPKAARESEANGEKARHESSRDRGEGFLNREATTNGGEFQGAIPVEYNLKAPNAS